jgi:hypothetical protein
MKKEVIRVKEEVRKGGERRELLYITHKMQYI